MEGVVTVLPKCSEHNLALQLIRVEISQEKVITDVYGCPFPECKTEQRSQQPRQTIESGK
jgi:hypothetical protein